MPLIWRAVRKARSLTALAEVFGAELDGSSCVVRDVDIAEPVQLEGVRAGRLELHDVLVDSQLVLRGCFIDSLVISGCRAASILLVNCHISQLAVRKLAAAENLVISGGEYVYVAVHDVGAVSLLDARCSGTVTITGPRRDVRAIRLTCGDLTIAEQVSARSASAQITLAECEIVGSLRVRDLHVSVVSVRQCHLERHLFLQRLVVSEALLIDQVRCVLHATLDCVTVAADRAEIVGCAFGDGLDARRLARSEPGSGRFVLRMLQSGVSGSLRFTVDAEPGRVLLHDTTVAGRLDFPEATAECELAGSTVIADLELPGTPMRTVRDIRSFVQARFGSSRVLGLAALRQALASRQRMTESDLCYFLQRNAEADQQHRTARWLAKTVFGGVLGWGVRWWEPFRALLAGILLTGLVLFTRDARPVPLPVRLVDNLVLAAALWLNVGTGSPQLLTSPGWAAAATALTAAGLILITVLVGITIRRLIR